MSTASNLVIIKLVLNLTDDEMKEKIVIRKKDCLIVL